MVYCALYRILDTAIGSAVVVARDVLRCEVAAMVAACIFLCIALTAAVKVRTGSAAVVAPRSICMHLITHCVNGRGNYACWIGSCGSCVLDNAASCLKP